MGFKSSTHNDIEKTYQKKIDLVVEPLSDEELARFVRATKYDANEAVFLGVLYKTGTGVQKDLEQALRWYTQAAELGNQESQMFVYTKGWS